MAETLERIINAGYPPNQIVVLTAYLAQKQVAAGSGESLFTYVLSQDMELPPAFAAILGEDPSDRVRLQVGIIMYHRNSVSKSEKAHSRQNAVAYRGLHNLDHKVI